MVVFLTPCVLMVYHGGSTNPLCFNGANPRNMLRDLHVSASSRASPAPGVLGASGSWAAPWGRRRGWRCAESARRCGTSRWPGTARRSHPAGCGVARCIPGKKKHMCWRKKNTCAVCLGKNKSRNFKLSLSEKGANG